MSELATVGLPDVRCDWVVFLGRPEAQMYLWLYIRRSALDHCRKPQSAEEEGATDFKTFHLWLRDDMTTTLQPSLPSRNLKT